MFEAASLATCYKIILVTQVSVYQVPCSAVYQEGHRGQHIMLRFCNFHQLVLGQFAPFTSGQVSVSQTFHTIAICSARGPTTVIMPSACIIQVCIYIQGVVVRQTIASFGQVTVYCHLARAVYASSFQYIEFKKLLYFMSRFPRSCRVVRRDCVLLTRPAHRTSGLHQSSVIELMSDQIHIFHFSSEPSHYKLRSSIDLR